MTERLSLSVEGGRKSNILSYYALLFQERASLMAQMVTNLPAGSIPGSGKSQMLDKI